MTANVRGFWVAGVFRLGRQIAGDRPPRYGKKADLPREEVPNLVNRVNLVNPDSDNQRLAGDRPPRYGKKADLPREEVPNLVNLVNPANPASDN